MHGRRVGEIGGEGFGLDLGLERFHAVGQPALNRIARALDVPLARSPVPPFAKVCGLIGLEMRFTPRGLRRTFNDLARLSNVEALMTKSISGHLTDRMRAHYSTVQPVEQRESIGRVLRLVVDAGVTSHEPTGGAPRPEVVRRGEVDAG